LPALPPATTKIAFYLGNCPFNTTVASPVLGTVWLPATTKIAFYLGNCPFNTTVASPAPCKNINSVLFWPNKRYLAERN
jgi:hypothetical protein